MKPVAFLFFSIVCITTIAQVPVSKEPRHHPVFENRKVRILNVLLPPGDTTQYHVHTTPSVFIMLSRTRTGSQLLNQQPGASGLPDVGNVFFENLSAPHIRIHRVWNMDTSVFHVMDIELLSKDTGFIQKPLQAKHLSLKTDTAWARIYKIELGKNDGLSINENKRNLILVSLKDSNTSLRINGKESASHLVTGNYFWINAGDKFSLKNSDAPLAGFALIEVK
ncbi:MAG: hypothetical protein ABUT20_29740 [Bacteroidota bacterium]